MKRNPRYVLDEESIDVLDEVVELLEGYVDVNDGEDGPVPNKAMRAVQLLQDLMRKEKAPSSHRFSNRKEIRDQFVPGLKLSSQDETGR